MMAGLFSAASSSLPPSENIHDQLRTSVRKAREQLPMRITEDLEAVDVTLQAGAVVYHYRLPNATKEDFRDPAHLEPASSLIIQDACGNSGVRKTILENGYAAIYRYTDMNGEMAGDIVVTPSDCGIEIRSRDRPTSRNRGRQT